jgi:iron complex transport system permease protein
MSKDPLQNHPARPEPVEEQARHERGIHPSTGVKRPALFWSILLTAWPLIFLACWKTGAVGIDWDSFLRTLGNSAPDEQTHAILFSVRLPRLLLAALTGAALSLTGAVFQALLRNALADPYVLGISGGAALGATVAVVLRLNATVAGVSMLPVFAFCGALGSLWLVYGFSRVRGFLSVHTMLLAGISLQAMLSALVLFLYTILDPFQLLEVFTWLMGHVPSPTYPMLAALTAVFLFSVALLLPHARDLNALVFGEREARSLGVETETLKRRLFLISSLLTGSVVALTGLIGFVGIMVPHVLRMLVGPDYRKLLPGCIAAGSLFLVVADTFSRSLVPPAEIPVGVLTALTGGPFFLFLLWKNRGELGS